VLPPDVLEVYKKYSREKMAQHGFVEEAIVQTMNDNCEQPYRILEKIWYVRLGYNDECAIHANSNCFPAYSRLVLL
jgi:hypothetical protein